MKKGLLQASGIVGICLAAISILIMIFVMIPLGFVSDIAYDYSYDSYYYSGMGFVWGIVIFCLIVMIVSLIGSIRILCIANKKPEEMQKSKGEVLVWGIVLILTNLISGILALVAYGSQGSDEVKKEKKGGVLEEQLKELKRLQDEGLITKEDFDKKKKKILDE